MDNNQLELLEKIKNQSDYTDIRDFIKLKEKLLNLDFSNPTNNYIYEQAKIRGIV